VTDGSLESSARAISRLATLGGSMLATLGLWELHTRLMADERAKARFLEAYRKGWSTAFLRALDVEVASDPAPRAGHRARLVVANHRSLLDVPVLIRHFGGRMLSKADVAAWPVAGPLARHAETIFVDREDRHSGAKAIREMRNALRDRSTLTVFPEGTVHPGDEVRPFQPGAFTAASGLDVEVLPVALAYAPFHEWGGIDTKTHVERLMKAPRATVGLAVGEPFRISGSARSVSEAAREAVQALVPRARQRASAR
jgi:lyso-ornithine lipid O-acyltransferase